MKITDIIIGIFCIPLLTACNSLLYESPQEPTPPVNTKTTSISKLNIAIPTAGNTWVLTNGVFTATDLVTTEGIRNWNNKSHTIRTYFYIAKAGTIALGLRAKVNSGTSKISVEFDHKIQRLELNNNSFNDISIGEFMIQNTGYYYIDVKGLEKDGTTFAEVDAMLLGGANVNDVKYIKDDFYFGRRGPSVHLNFDIPNNVDRVEWFYSELNVPKNQDVEGSYFMANGFGEGYLGIQVNSPTERKILFSIWSPFETDNPKEIPKDYKIELLKKGEDVTVGEFGNEGSGGQSYKVFDWKTDVNYAFLVGAKPTGNGKTDYTAYFHDPEKSTWHLIAQFRRPKTDTYLKHLYSFLENFMPEQGVIARKATYGNQWVYDSYGWHELTNITFTADVAARKEYRLDYSGGIENNFFYLKNCGFTDDKVKIDSRFKRAPLNIAPNINFLGLK